MAKKIAIPTREGMIDDHFGHCAYYTVFTLDEQNQVMNQERATQCKLLKGVGTKVVLRECPDCVADAAEFLEEYIPSSME